MSSGCTYSPFSIIFSSSPQTVGERQIPSVYDEAGPKFPLNVAD